jgi:hypothetical protein
MAIFARGGYIDNLVLTTAGSEYSYPLQTVEQDTSVKRFQLKSKENADMKYAYKPGGPYVTIPAGHTKWEDEIDVRMFTLYIVGTANGQTAEIEWWN